MSTRNRLFGVLAVGVVFMTLLMVFPGFTFAEEESAGGDEPSAAALASLDAAGEDINISPIVPTDVVENEIVPPPVDDSSDKTEKDKKDKDKKPDEPDPDDELEAEGLLASASGGIGDGTEGGIYSIPTAVDSVYTGAAVYNIPIVVPPGRKGVQPSIALTYNSYTSNGWVGVGWDLEIGSIERSTKRGMDYSANDYVSTRDGELVSRSSDWGTNYYGAKVEGAFSKYYYNSSTSGWEVTAKGGTKYFYGSTSSSRLNNGLGNFKWCLDKVLDTNGNYMTVSYTKDSGQIYPAQIDYTGNTGLSTTKSVVFTLEDRTDELLSYKSKTQQITAKRLQKIAAYADSQLAREYVLSYTYNSIAGQSQLTQVQTKGANGETTVQPTAFSYNTGGGDGSNTFGVMSRSTAFGVSRGIFFGDINGDGRDDLIETVEYNNQIYAISYIANNNGYLDYYGYFVTWCESLALGDVDGDRCADIVTDGGTRVYKSLGNGGFGSVIYTGISSKDSFQLADINGDGLSDLITHSYSNGYVYSYLANGSGTVFSTSGATHTGTGGIGAGTVNLVDVNGDGMADLLKYYLNGQILYTYLSNGNGAFSYSGTSTSLGASSPDQIHYSDINGDGLTDIIASRPYISAGNGSFIQYSTTLSCKGVADVNGDGLGDLIKIDYNWNLCVSLSKGNGEFYPWMIAGGYPTDPSTNIYIADVNGDGLSDVSKYNDSYDVTCISVAMTIDGPANYLSTVTNELGGTSTVTYTKSSVYPDNYCPYIIYPVSQITTNDGIRDSTTQYIYEGATYDYEYREFWGFEISEKTNPDSSKIETSYFQTPYLKGRADLVETKAPDGTLLKRTDYYWTTYPSTPSTYGFAKLLQTNTVYEGNPNLSSNKGYTYDNTNGNLLTNVTYGTGAETITQTNTYVNKGTWVWRPYVESVSGSSSGLVRRTTNIYESTTGNLLTTTYYSNSGTDPVVSMTYDAYGNVTTVTDAELNTTSTIYDSTYTYPVTITLPTTSGVTHETEQLWDNRFGKIVTSTDQNGFDTDYTYDGYGRLTQVDYPDTGQTLYTYYDTATPNRYVNKQVKENASSYVASRSYYDGLGRVIQTESTGESGKTIITQSVYDIMGRNSRTNGPYFSGDTQYPYSRVVSYDYLSRPLITKSLNTTGGNAFVYYAYSGFSITVTDPDGNIKTQTTDHLGRIIEVEEQNGSSYYTTTYEYNAAGDLTEISDNSNNTTTYNYNTLGQKTAMNDPDMGAWSYTYDLNGNLLTQTDAKSQVITFTYDELNRVTSKTYYPSNPMVYYFYDSGTNGVGFPYQVANANATTTYNSYDAMGRSTSVTKTITGDSARTTQYTYDLSGKVLTTTYPDGYYVTNAYIAGTNLLSTVTGSDGEVYASISNYTPSGKIGTLVHDNGTTTTYSYSAYTGNVTDIVTTNGSTLQNRHYTYSNSGDINSVVDSVAGVTYNYTYDDLHRLTNETNNGGYGAMNVTYNAIGNITQKTVGSNTFYICYDSSHKHAVDYVNYNSTNYDYTYDANGNMTQGYDFSNLSSIQVRTVTYNVDNMPTSIYHGSGTTASLLYDGSGARAKKTVSGGSSSTTYYVGAHFEVKDGTTTKYIFAGNLRVAQVKGSTLSYFHKDHLGSSTLMTDDSGTLLESTNYEPFGGQRAHTGTDTSSYKFTDQEFDAESGLYNYDARMYDPVIGRFISPDSTIPGMYNPQSLNRYSYCLNNPLIYIDPSGHDEYTLSEVVCYSNGTGSSRVDWFGLLAGPFFQQCPGTWGLMYGALFSAFFGVPNVMMPRAADYNIPIDPSNYDPNNTDPTYRERAIVAAKDYLLEKTGVDVKGIKTNWDAEYDGTACGSQPGNRIELYNCAFESFEELASVIGHESVHYDQRLMSLLPATSWQQHCATEAAASYWEYINRDKLGLSPDEVTGILDTFNGWYNSLDPEYQVNYDKGWFSPYKTDDGKYSP